MTVGAATTAQSLRSMRRAGGQVGPRTIVSKLMMHWLERWSVGCGSGTRRSSFVNRPCLEHPDEPHGWVSDEAISLVLHLQGRGDLNAELTDALRTSWAHRRHKGSYPAPPLKRPQEGE